MASFGFAQDKGATGLNLKETTEQTEPLPV